MKMTYALLTAFSCWFIAFPATAQTVQYFIEDIGPALPETSRSFALAEDGASTGLFRYSDGSYGMFVSRGGETRVVAVSSGFDLFPFGILNATTAVGYIQEQGLAAKPLIYRSSAGLQKLRLPPFFRNGGAFALNKNAIAGAAFNDAEDLRLTIWQHGVPRVLPYRGVPMAINNRSDIAGFIPADETQAHDRAFVLRDNQFIDLGSGPYPYVLETRALGNNDCNDIVGYANDQGGSTGIIAYDGAPFVVPNEEYLVLNDINNRRQAVGTNLSLTPRPSLIILNVDGTVSDLLSAAVNPQQWFAIPFASGINDKGEIAGTGYVEIGRDGDNVLLGFRAFIARPINPNDLPPLACP